MSAMQRLDPRTCFESPRTDQDLARRSVRGGMVNLTSQAVQLVLRMAGMLILARILSPADYGLLAMALVLLNFVQIFKDAGLSMATVQRRSVSRGQVSTLFWLNTLIGLLAAVLVMMVAPLLSWFFGRPELTAIAAVLSISIFVGALTNQHEALLWRHMRFQVLAFIQVSSLLANTAVAVGLALAGFRYWSLVAGVVVQSVTAALLTFYFCPWVPGKAERNTGVRGMLAFGGHLTGFNIVNYFARNADNVLIGKFIGASALGLYSRAYQLLMMPLSQIRGPLDQVAMPALSSLLDEPGRYARYYRRLLEVSLLIMVPLVVICALEADFIIRLVLGPQWAGAAGVFRILALAGLVQTISTTRGLVMISSGRHSRFFYWGVFNSLLMVAAFAAGLSYGISGVAAAYTLANYIILFPSLAYCFHGTPVTMGMFLRSFYPSILTVLPALAAFMLARQAWPGDSFPAHFLRSAAFIAVFFLFSWGRRAVRETVGVVLKGLRPAWLERRGTRGGA